MAQSKAKKSGTGKGSARPAGAAKPTAKKAAKPTATKAAKPKAQAAVRSAPAGAPKAKAPAAGKKPPAKPAAQTKAPPSKPATTKTQAVKTQAVKPQPVKDAAVKAPTAKAPAVAGKAAPTPVEAGKPKPKGITVVAPKPVKKVKPKKVIEMPRLGGPLLGPGGKKWKPLIPSGPNAAPVTQLTRVGDGQEIKSHLPKKELERYKDLLTRKRVLLAGDVQNMENQALTAGSGALSAVPQHIAEQGSDTYDQSLSLDLAQVDRNLIKEIDDALERIEKGTFGICEVTGKPISKERLDELPWTRYSIEAARERERRSYRA